MSDHTTRSVHIVNYVFIIIVISVSDRVVQVLDMCAAPGSKTAQLIEALHAEDNQESTIPSVCVCVRVWVGGEEGSLLYMYVSK